MVQSLAFGLSFLQRMDMKPVVVMGCFDNQESGPVEAVTWPWCTKGAPHSIVVDISLLQWSLDCGTIPLVCPVGRNGRGCSLVLDPTEVTAAISRALQPLKVIFLNNSGGLRSEKHKAQNKTSCISLEIIKCTPYLYLTHPYHFLFELQVLDMVSLPTDLPGLSGAEWLSPAERRRLTTIARLLNQLPTESSAVITSADTLLTELFSHRGEAGGLSTKTHFCLYTETEAASLL
ncbi:hypothetical protein XENOCAPTIV_017025 [Xenoophorus captivus]|uniref:Uncharacterized protein n=1 Tax=Xenoophorus captivus TaxID=1517983 RepID=A0ABV0Q5B1_9TELE